MSFQISLESFEGPLDLLLYLIRRDEIDIHDIPVAHITGEYLKLLQVMEDLDIGVGGEFLVMASMLMEMKSQMMLARGQPGRKSKKEELDPRIELVRQLLEYRQYKDAAGQLTWLEEEQSQRYFHPIDSADLMPPEEDRPPDTYIRADLWDLVAAYGRLLSTMGNDHPMEIPFDDTPIEVYTQRLLERIGEAEVAFVHCLDARDLLNLIGMFLALLELLKERRVVAVQHEQCGEIYLTLGPGKTVDLDDLEPPEDALLPPVNPELN